MGKMLACMLVVLCCQSSLGAQNGGFAGALIGVSTLSADGRSVVTMPTAAVSVYKPENGAALNLFAGVALADFLSVQGNYVWNRNSMTLTSTLTSDDRQEYYEQARDSMQHAVIGDVLIYFRKRGDPVRPYLSAGLGFVHFESTERELLVSRDAGRVPPEVFTSTKPALRVAVGIDVVVGGGWSLRYSFSETLTGNPISSQLSPTGQRNLANFQNLFGIVRHF